MKKRLLNILFLTFVLFPILINAEGIKSVDYTGVTEADSDSEIYTDLAVYFDGVSTDKNIAIIAIEYDLLFDSKVIKPIAAETTDFDDFYVTKTGGWKVSSMVYGSLTQSTSKEVSAINRCDIEKYYCNDTYNSRWYFTSLKNATKTTKIQIKNLKVYAIDYTDQNKLMVLEDKYDQTLSIEVKINKVSSGFTAGKTNGTLIKSSKATVSNATKNAKSTSSSTNKTSTTSSISKKSSNTYLKSLTIKGYKIDFNKDKYKYEIEVDKDINSLTLSYKTEDKKAKVEVYGAKDLKAHGDEVSIVVTAEDLSNKEYTVFINRKVDKIKEKFSIRKLYKQIKTKILASKKNKIIAAIIAGNIALIALLVLVISKVNGKKIDKFLDKM